MASRCSADTASSASIRSSSGTATRARSVSSKAPRRSEERVKNMIDFTLTENDKKVLDAVREESLIARNYARYYDEHEEEFPPDALPEAKGRPGFYSMLGGRELEDTGMNVL